MEIPCAICKLVVTNIASTSRVNCALYDVADALGGCYGWVVPRHTTGTLYPVCMQTQLDRAGGKHNRARTIWYKQVLLWSTLV